MKAGRPGPRPAPTAEIRAVRRAWGAERLPDGTTRFRLWAPLQESLRLRLDGAEVAMERHGDGWFEWRGHDVPVGARYGFVLGDGRVVPDPASRAQDGGLEGASLLTDPEAYVWAHSNWAGRPWEETVLYELHVGTFTPEGTFRAAAERLPRLVEAGITTIELMPVAQFPGERGWGYDGVLTYAPHHAYGAPDDLKALVDAAHGLGLSVMLDVVYNHFGPRGNYLHLYAPFFHSERQTPWGATIAFERAPVRDFFIDNAVYWLREFNLDGLRLDAVHAIDDSSARHVLDELAERVRRECPGRRRRLVTEDSRNLAGYLARHPDGTAKAYDATWNDDLHHVARVIAARETDGVMADFAGDRWRYFARALAEGFVFQGDAPPGSGVALGEPSAHLPPTAFVGFLQNHDQIGNRAFGVRMEAVVDLAMMRAMTTILMLSPHVPLVFMGDEYGERRPFLYFCDYDDDLAEIIHASRLPEAALFGGVPAYVRQSEDLPDPNDPALFAASRLDWAARDSHTGAARLAFFRALVAARRAHVLPGLAAAAGHAGRIRAAHDGVIAVDWHLNGRRLQVRANLARAARPMPPVRGDIVHAEPAGTMISEAGTQPAVSVVVAVAPL